MGIVRQAPWVLGIAALVAGCGGDPGGAKPTSTTPAGAAEFAAAPAGATRATLSLDTFDVPPGGEVYKCQNFQNPFSHDVAILQSQSTMSPGSHHLAVFRQANNDAGALEDCSGLEFATIVHAAQAPKERIQYPEGVGVFLPGAIGVRLNAHYLNLTNDTIHTKVEVALDAADSGEVTYTASQIYMNDGTLNVAPGDGTAGGTLAIPAEVGDVKLLSAQSHMHRHATHFVATAEDGSTLYEANSWNEPPIKVFDPVIPMAAGGSVTWKCDIHNDTSAALTFGESADTNEMCVFTAFYYPAPNGQTIVGDTSIGSMFLTK
jgi:hypothetical protein